MFSPNEGASVTCFLYSLTTPTLIYFITCTSTKNYCYESLEYRVLECNACVQDLSSFITLQRAIIFHNTELKEISRFDISF